MENVILASFNVESEAYQAFSEIKRELSSTSYIVSQAMLIKREGNAIVPLETFDSGIHTGDDTVTGGMIGAVIGILGGPLGVLLGIGIGTLTGVVIDAGDISRDGSIMEKIALTIGEGSIAIVALAQEQSLEAMDAKFSKYKAAVSRYDAAQLEAEIDEAKKIQKEIQKEARAQLRKQASDERHKKIEGFRNKMKEDFAEFKQKLSK